MTPGNGELSRPQRWGRDENALVLSNLMVA